MSLCNPSKLCISLEQARKVLTFSIKYNNVYLILLNKWEPPLIFELFKISFLAPSYDETLFNDVPFPV